MNTNSDWKSQIPSSSCRMFGKTLGMLGLLIGLSNVVVDDAAAQDDFRSIPEIKWDTTIEKIQFDADKFVGQRLTVKCPAAPSKQSFAGLSGTNVYPSNSPICIAALHAGKITKEGGTVTLQLNPGRENYEGSEQNGVKSANLPETSRSIAFIDDSTPQEIDDLHLLHIPRIDWDTKFTATGFANRNLVGQRFTFRCDAAPRDLKPRTLYGTDVYDFSTRICRAAMHAGRITKDGGVVTVQLDMGVPKLFGSIRYGVETRSKGSSGSGRSLTFVDSPVEDSVGKEEPEKQQVSQHSN